jgi:hypothetical protein
MISTIVAGATFPPTGGKGCTSSMLAVFLTKDTHSGCTADAVSLASQAPKISPIVAGATSPWIIKKSFGKQKRGVFVPRMSLNDIFPGGKGYTSSMLAVFLTKDTHSGCTADAVSLALQAPRIFFILLV